MKDILKPEVEKFVKKYPNKIVKAVGDFIDNIDNIDGDKEITFKTNNKKIHTFKKRDIIRINTEDGLYYLIDAEKMK